jgi:hypothetical protein
MHGSSVLRLIPQAPSRARPAAGSARMFPQAGRTARLPRWWPALANRYRSEYGFTVIKSHAPMKSSILRHGLGVLTLATAIGCAASVAATGEKPASEPKSAAAGKAIKQPSRSAQKAQVVRTKAITGSRIPCKVDENGRPLDSTLTVIVVDEKTINLMGGGDPMSALSRLPMASVRGR